MEIVNLVRGVQVHPPTPKQSLVIKGFSISVMKDVGLSGVTYWWPRSVPNDDWDGIWVGDPGEE